LETRKRTSDIDAGKLWDIATRILAIGELIKFRGGEAPLDEEEVNYGIGELLTGLARELMQVSDRQR